MTKISEVVKLKTGYAKDTVYRWISERNMPGHKIGRLFDGNGDTGHWVAAHRPLPEYATPAVSVCTETPEMEKLRWISDADPRRVKCARSCSALN